MEHLDAHAQRLARSSRRAVGHDHELLRVELVVGVRAAVHDVHERHRQRARVDAAHVAVERLAGGLGGGLGHGQRDRQDRVGAQPALVRRCRPARSCSWSISAWSSASSPDHLARQRVVDRGHRLLARRGPGSASCRRRAARPPRARRSRRPRARRPGRSAPPSSTTSASTVGLPRLSRISRANTDSMLVISPSSCHSGSSTETRSPAPRLRGEPVRTAGHEHSSPGVTTTTPPSETRVAAAVLGGLVADHRAARHLHVAVDDGAPDPAVAVDGRSSASGSSPRSSQYECTRDAGREDRPPHRRCRRRCSPSTPATRAALPRRPSSSNTNLAGGNCGW